MKGLYKLCNFQFLNLFVKGFAVCVGLFIMQIIAFSGQTFDLGIRFEQFMQHSGFNTMFLLAYILLLVIIALSVYQRYFGSKSIYTIMALPVSKGVLYLSFILPAILIILMLCLTQIISVYVCHQILIEKITERDVSRVYMNNSLFLSFIRYDYLRLLLPLSFLDLARSIILLIAPVVTIVYGAFCERSHRYLGEILVLIQLSLVWRLVIQINDTSITTSYRNSIIYICISFALTVMFAILSCKMLSHKSVV